MINWAVTYIFSVKFHFIKKFFKIIVFIFINIRFFPVFKFHVFCLTLVIVLFLSLLSLNDMDLLSLFFFSLFAASFNTNCFQLATQCSAWPYLSASAQFSHFYTIPSGAFCLLRSRPSFNSRRHTIALVFLCLSGTIEVNPGPAFSLCTQNIRSLNSDHFLVLYDIIHDHQYEITALSETWLTSCHTPAEFIDLVPTGYGLLSHHWTSSIGGGVSNERTKTSPSQ